nr:MAG TPA: hypothetical protein [Caudoviricetes sp.]
MLVLLSLIYLLLLLFQYIFKVIKNPRCSRSFWFYNFIYKIIPRIILFFFFF